MSKGNPIPTKFDAPEQALLLEIRRRSGLSVSEIVRRAVRFLRQHLEAEHPDLTLILVDLSPDMPDPVPAKQPKMGKEKLRVTGKKKQIRELLIPPGMVPPGQAKAGAADN